MNYIYISHSASDHNQARRLADHFINTGYNIWLEDHTEDSEGRAEIIKTAIADCACFLVLLSPKSEDWRRVENEINLAREYKKSILGLRLGGVKTKIPGKYYAENLSKGKNPTKKFALKLSELIPFKSDDAANVTTLATPNKDQPDTVMNRSEAFKQLTDLFRGKLTSKTKTGNLK